MVKFRSIKLLSFHCQSHTGSLLFTSKCLFLWCLRTKIKTFTNTRLCKIFMHNLLIPLRLYIYAVTFFEVKCVNDFWTPNMPDLFSKYKTLKMTYFSYHLNSGHLWLSPITRLFNKPTSKCWRKQISLYCSPYNATGWWWQLSK